MMIRYVVMLFNMVINSENGWPNRVPLISMTSYPTERSRAHFLTRLASLCGQELAPTDYKRP